jgi:hypothetical protein
MTDISKDDSPAATGDYSATKAPENREHVTSERTTMDARLKPGGAHGTPAEVGMSGLHHEDVPSKATDLDLVNYGENPAGERKDSGKE